MPKIKLNLALLTGIILLSGLIYASSLINSNPPTPTGHTLEDLYNLIVNNTPIIPGNHSLSPNTSTSTPTMHSVSEIYVALANLLNADHIIPGTTYLGVTGGGITPDPIDPISKEFTPTSDPNNTTSYTLDDIANLINNNIRLITPNIPSSPTTTPASTMLDISNIYLSLENLIDPSKLVTGESYLGVEGEYIPGPFSGGDGSEGDPYQIATCYQLQNMNTELSAYYILVDDIDCSDTINWNDGLGFDPIGFCVDEADCHANSEVSFIGVLNGDGHIVYDLYINRPDEDYVGLFNSVDGGMYSGGDFRIQVKNIGLENVNITGKDRVGSLIGQYSWTQYESGISQVYTTGSVNGRDHVGGIIGYLRDAGIKDSYSRTDVSGDNYIGGLVGSFVWGRTQNTYATGNVSGNSSVGGLHGQSAAVNFGIYLWIHYSFTTSYINGDENTSGGISGNIGLGGLYQLLNSRWYDQVGDSATVCIDGGVVISPNCSTVVSEDYFKGNVYPSSQPMASWDFPGTWQEVVGDYPVLTWQGIGGEVN